LLVITDFKWYSIVHELGDDECPYEHTHFAFEWPKKIDTCNPRIFDIAFNGEQIHPHIQPFRDDRHKATIYFDYHNKAPVLLEQSETGPERPDELYQQIRDCKTIGDAAVLCKVEVKSYSDLRIIRGDVAKPDDFVHEYPDAIWNLHAPFDWRVLYIWGPTGIGKTQWACAQFHNPLVVSHLDGLKQFERGRHDGIVFDDMDFSTIERVHLIHLFDWDLERQISGTRYACAIIPKNTRKIVCSNLPYGSNIGVQDNQGLESDGAIRRRFTRIIHCHSTLYRSPPQADQEDASEINAEPDNISHHGGSEPGSPTISDLARALGSPGPLSLNDAWTANGDGDMGFEFTDEETAELATTLAAAMEEANLADAAALSRALSLAALPAEETKESTD
jgi:hypothetical protein